MILHGGEPRRSLIKESSPSTRRLKPSTDDSVKLLVEELTIPGVKVNGTIIDIETTDLDPEYGELITFGYITSKRNGSILKSITRTKSIPYPRFIQEVRGELSTLRQPFYAYNKNFEQAWFDYLGLLYSWKDLMGPLKRSANVIRNKTPYKVKWSKLHEVFPLRFLRYFGLSDFDVGNEEISALWDEHLQTGSLKPLMMITQHNVLDLLTEALTLIWEPTLNRLSEMVEAMTREEASSHIKFKCQVCGRTFFDPTELVYTQRVEKREDNTFRVIEMEVCKDCFYRLLSKPNSGASSSQGGFPQFQDLDFEKYF